MGRDRSAILEIFSDKVYLNTIREKLSFLAGIKPLGEPCGFVTNK